MSLRRLAPWTVLAALGLLVALAALFTWWGNRSGPSDLRTSDGAALAPGAVGNPAEVPGAAASRAQQLTRRLDAALLRVRSDAAAVPGAPQFAVMPFDAPADDEELQGLAASLCDALLELMTRDGAPRGSACNSARVAAQVGMSPREVAGLLGVPALLSGSLARDGEGVRLEARLTASQGGAERWRHAASYSPAELIEMPRQLAQRLAATSAGADHLAADAASAAAAPNGQAYGLFLRALHQQRRGDTESLQVARRLLDESLALAPDYAPAITASVSLNSNLAGVGLASGAAVDEQVREAAARLARVAPDSPQAALMGAAAAVGAQRWAEALRLLDDGVARHPQHMPLRHTQAGILLMMGYLQRGQQAAWVVAQREPLNGSSHERLARAWSLLGDNDRMQESAALAAELGWASRVRGFDAWHALRTGDLQTSERAWREQLDAVRLPADWVGPMLQAHRDPSARPAAVAALQTVPEGARRAMNQLFLAYAIAGEVDLAIEALDGTRDAVATMWVSDLWLPELADLRADKGFVPYLQALGLPALWQAHGLPDRCRQAADQTWQCT